MSESEVNVSDMVVIILGTDDVVMMVVVSGDLATTFSVAARVFSVAVVIVVMDISVTLLDCRCSGSSSHGCFSDATRGCCQY